MYETADDDAPKFVTKFHLLTQPKKEKKRKTRCCNLEKFVNYIIHLFRQIRALVLVTTGFGGLFIFYFTYHFFVRPSVYTLRTEFIQTNCTVVRVDIFKGKSNCDWSSCRVGCTNDEIYECWQILVMTSNFSSEFLSEDKVSLENSTYKDYNSSYGYDVSSEKATKLFISLPGCVYTTCNPFLDRFTIIDYEFKCYLSSDYTIAIPVVYLDYNEVNLNLLYGLIPIILSVVSLLSIYWTYCRKNATDNTLSLAPNEEALKEREKKNQLELLQELQKHKPKDEKIDFKAVVAMATNKNRNKVAPYFHSDSSTNLLQDNEIIRPNVKNRWHSATEKLIKNSNHVDQLVNKETTSFNVKEQWKNVTSKLLQNALAEKRKLTPNQKWKSATSNLLAASKSPRKHDDEDEIDLIGGKKRLRTTSGKLNLTPTQKWKNAAANILTISNNVKQFEDEENAHLEVRQKLQSAETSKQKVTPKQKWKNAVANILMASKSVEPVEEKDINSLSVGEKEQSESSQEDRF